jgi:acetolactate synthase-1/2/3 large subunit
MPWARPLPARERPVLALIGDGTAMYTIQALWTMAREGLNVTAIIFNNASYSVLNVELERVGAEGQAPRPGRSST